MSLVEILIAVTLMGFAIVSLIGAWQAAISLSVQSKERADLQVVLQSAAEAVASSDVPLHPCNPGATEAQNQADTVNAYQPYAVKADLSGRFTVVVQRVDFYTGDPSVARPWSSVCPDAEEYRMELITIAVTQNSDGRANAVEVIKE